MFSEAIEERTGPAGQKTEEEISSGLRRYRGRIVHSVFNSRGLTQSVAVIPSLLGYDTIVFFYLNQGEDGIQGYENIDVRAVINQAGRDLKRRPLRRTREALHELGFVSEE
jgi:hypothetical protein